MRKRIFGRQLSRDTNERKALFKGLINSLVMEESITTTEAKAKSIRAQVEKLITKAKRKGEASRSLLQPWLQPVALEKVLSNLAVRYNSRPGGYTRIITVGERFGDSATMAVIELVDKSTDNAVESKKAKQSVNEKDTAVNTSTEKQPAQKLKSPKKSQQPKKTQRPPSKAEMEKRSAGKGSPKKESK